MNAETRSLDKTISVGLDYLLSMQAGEGAWTEWELPPGSSAIWTTAYVGFQLRHLPLDLALRVKSHITSAALWLNNNEFVEGGWGFNQRVGVDADTTAYAILFLTSAGQPVSEKAYAVLGNLQCADGGFSTYPPVGEHHSWNVSHPDVSPMALLALLTAPSPNRIAIQRGIEYVLNQKTSGGLWNSFWWKSCLYGTAASLSVLAATGIEMPSSSALSQIKPDNAFETALLISSLLYIHQENTYRLVHDLANELIHQQLPDGSWNSAPILRITRRNCYAPWESDDAGQLYPEPHRLFTTATVLKALIKARKVQPASILNHSILHHRD